MQIDTLAGRSVETIAELAGASDLFVFRRVGGARFVHVGGAGRGEGWAGNIDLDTSDRGAPALAIAGDAPVRVVHSEVEPVFGPYYARAAVFVSVAPDALIVFGSTASDLSHLEDDDARALAVDAEAAVAHVSPAKRLADELEVLHAIERLATSEKRDLHDVMEHVANCAAEALGCELAVLYLASPERLTVAERGYSLHAGREAAFDAMRSLAAAAPSGPVCVQDARSELIGDPFGADEGIRSYYLLPIGDTPIAYLLLMHTVVVPRGFTLLCQELGLRLAQCAESMLRAALMRENEARLQESQKLESLGVLAGGIAHDFNNLLVGVLGNAELLAAELPGDERLHRRVRAIEESALRAAELSRQMLIYSGRGEHRLERIDLSHAVAEVERLLQSAASRSATIAYELTPGIGVEADGAQLRQLTLALVTNAGEALDGEPGLIRVATRVVRGSDFPEDRFLLEPDERAAFFACLEVSDTGSGMSDAIAAKIFEPFYTTKFTGRGLGLAAAMGIVRAHGGAISVRTAPGEGCTIRVLLPLAEANASAPAVEPAVAVATVAGAVLVVDDEPSVCAVASAMLEQAGFEVLAVDNGDEALRLVAEEGDRLGAVLLDLTMPKLSGAETLKRLRALGSGLPVVITSGYAEGADFEAHDAGAWTSFLQKPFASAELVARMREAMAARAL